MKKITLLLGVLSFSLCVSAQTTTKKKKSGGLGKILTDVITTTTQTGGGILSNDDIASGLKEALAVGISTGSELASKNDGFFLNPKIKIPLPPDVQKIESTLRSIGLGGEVDKFVLALNRGAENASKAAKPIFISAIKNLTFSDVISIFKGEKNAATNYLRKSTNDALVTAFMPSVDSSLAQTQATAMYSGIATKYNTLPFIPKKINPDLKGYATQKAVDGLFYLVEQEEIKIRENPIARTTEILKKVFGQK